MITVERPRPGDFEAIAANAAEPWARQSACAHDLSALVNDRQAYVALWNESPIFIGGYVDFGHGAAVSWSMFGPPPREVLLPLVRVVRANLAAAPFRWIEAHCIEDFAPAIRWVRALGFMPLEGCGLMINDRVFQRYVWRR